MAVARHTMECIVAAAITVFGGIIIAGSMQLSIGWASTGPQSGYFPFRLGVMLCITGLLLLAQMFFDKETRTFVTGEQLKHSFAMFLPTLFLVVLMPFLGCYVSSCFYILYMMRRHGEMPWPKALLLAFLLIAALYGLFDYWFMVPLAKGPLEAWLGIY